MNSRSPVTNGDCYVPYEQRTGNESLVYFTRDLSADGLRRIYARVNANITGRVGVKLHTGEKNGPNILPRAWVRELMENELKGATIVETNTYYEGDRYTTPEHLETLKVNGWDFCPVDIMDADGVVMMPVEGSTWMKEVGMGSHVMNYDSLVALTHFKGHVQGGFGGSNKNLGIGMADGRVGKAAIHTLEGSDWQWSIREEEFMERISESTKATLDHFGKHITFVNVMRNMSVDCDCAGVGAAPVVTPNVGILASVDVLAVDQACVDCVWAMKDEDHADLCERVTSRHGLRQLSAMKELGMGNDKYKLIDIDNDDAVITAADAVKDVVPFVAPPMFKG